MTGNERPDIYADGLREERCENCLHCCATVLRTVHGVERTEYECGRRPEFVHRTQGLVRCNYWESAATRTRQGSQPHVPGHRKGDGQPVVRADRDGGRITPDKEE